MSKRHKLSKLQRLKRLEDLKANQALNNLGQWQKTWHELCDNQREVEHLDKLAASYVLQAGDTLAGWGAHNWSTFNTKVLATAVSQKKAQGAKLTTEEEIAHYRYLESEVEHKVMQRLTEKLQQKLQLELRKGEDLLD